MQLFMLHSLHIILSCTVSSHLSKLIHFKHADMFQNIRDPANVKYLTALNTSVIKQTFTEIIKKNYKYLKHFLNDLRYSRILKIGFFFHIYP